ncbi:hypothetical protein PCANC_21306 [Puccinia coronata f. sp. avenae]|uniref:Uncharacterized protein n=1 Tax=Puccinia coronata f. sp. avenae TaxID=200324 RepID=A0A2N5UJR4_9BASI|nr:hypothetical protein PCANC_21306 [Puccinia coronata f. sp. avenae]
MSARLGKKLKEKIFKAIGDRRPAIIKLIDHFNQCYLDYVKQFPNQKLADFDGKLTYDTFLAMTLDDPFWNDGLYYHCKAPWAIDPHVQTGINCILLLRRIQEEFQLLAQELSCAVGWAISYHQLLKSNIDYLQSLFHQSNSPGSIIDDLHMAGMNRKNKIKCIARELRLRLFSHQRLVKDWSDDVKWLWRVCQPNENKQHISKWNELIDKVHEVRRGWGVEDGLGDLVDDKVEEAGLDVEGDDGEDADDDWVDKIGYAPVNQENVNTNDGDASL